MNHTTGPWHVGMRPGPIIYGALGEQIADLRGPSLGNEETSANAHLIASAPELLRALEGLVDDWERVTNRTLPDDHEVKAAIAKAKGGAL